MAPPMIRENVSGVYGYPTSTMDWCEENFVVTYAIAEFWNTISNWVMIFPPMFVAYRLWKFQLAENRVITAFIALMAIGFGSFAFHCTLLYQSQLLDELPMIYGTCVMLYCMLELRGIENKLNIFTSAVLIAISIAITMIYVLLKNPLIFLYSYGTLATTLFMLNIRACARYTGNRKLLILSLASYTFGFILWNIDNEYCHKVRKVRNALPFLFQPITQLHALWHFFAGIGTYGQIIFTMDLRIKCLRFESRSAYICKYILYFIKAQSFKHNFKANKN